MNTIKRLEMVENYLNILGLKDHARDFTFLRELVSRHVATFAFSSLGVQLGDSLPLDFESIYERIVVRQRGGYCFEQNGLLFEILKELGFRPQLHLARVARNQDMLPGLTHRISVVNYDGERYVMDVGFGADGPRLPVPLSGKETADGERLFRIAQGEPDVFHMQVVKKGEFSSLYRFELVQYGEADCELGHFYSHRHPDAVFVNRLMVSRLLQGETRSLLDLKYRIITETATKRREITGADQLREILGREFRLQISVEESHRLYEKLSSKG